MKFSILLTLRGSYSNGGNTGKYDYKLIVKDVSALAKNIWQLRAFMLKLPAATKTITAYQITSSVGAPPAFGTRVITINTAGLVTFTDASETLEYISLKVTLSDVEDHPYEIMSCMIPAHDLVGTDTIWNGVVSVAASEDEWVSNDSFIIDAAYAMATHTFTGTGITDSKVKVFGFVVAETDLVMREYTGQYTELALKVITSLGQAAKKHYEGIVAQVANYLQSGSSPMALELVLNNHEVTIGEGV
jgi:hypothetical protein